VLLCIQLILLDLREILTNWQLGASQDIDRNSGVIYAADFSLGAYVSPDRGESWYPINDGLTNRAVCALSLSPDGGMLFAATSGDGVFRLDIPHSGPRASPGTRMTSSHVST